jgi:hypothetical protein
LLKVSDAARRQSGGLRAGATRLVCSAVLDPGNLRPAGVGDAAVARIVADRQAVRVVVMGGKNMFTIVRKFRLTRGSVDEVTRRVKVSFVPLLRGLPGFDKYYLLDGGQETLISIRVFDSAEEALASNDIAAEWMRDNVLEFVKGMPEVMAGNVIIAESK